ncbi:MAG: hypothetical protein ABJC98_23365, partial [Bacteroidota bacterium]
VENIMNVAACSVGTPCAGKKSNTIQFNSYISNYENCTKRSDGTLGNFDIYSTHKMFLRNIKQASRVI